MLVLQSNFKFKNETPDVENLSLVGTENGYISAHEFNTIREDILMKNFDEISEYARRNKNPVKGIVIVRDSDGNFQQFKVTRNGCEKTPCDINITVKNNKEKKKSFTFAEKMDMLRIYVSEHQQLPDSTVSINDCNLGTFVKKLGVDEEHVAEFAAIKDLMTKSSKRK